MPCVFFLIGEVAHWPGFFAAEGDSWGDLCQGHFQSPIDIEPKNARPSRGARPELGPGRMIVGKARGVALVWHIYIFFPTCQVRVVRFYQSCSSPPSSSPTPSPPPPLPPLLCPLPPCQLFAKLFANFRTQWALLDLNCKGLSALGTAGPQPGTFRAQ